jgi:hypothetical protein
VQGLTVVAVGPDARGEDVIMAEEVEWFVGSDWASETHQICLVDARGECVGERSVAHGGAVLGELCDWLIARTGARPEAIALLVRGCPVTRRSGKSCIVLRRYARNRRLQTALYHWARVATQHDETNRNRYAELRRRGHSPTG